jgi:tetratricopeptide (TPR) repeat protein
LPFAPPSLPPGSTGIDDRDRTAFDDLARRIDMRAPVSASDLHRGEELVVRYPNEAGPRALLENLLLLASDQERAARRPSQAAAHARRANEVQPGSANAGKALLFALIEDADWPAAEAAARALLAHQPRNPEALRALGFALMRQDRGPEAREALRASLEARDDASTRALFDMVSKSLADQQGMTEQRLSHFHVRYDGGQHEDVGREVLRALERHYSTLARTLDHQPAATIPVVLFSQRAYFDATGAPAWSGGQYDHFDGRITVPIGGLTSSLTPTLDAVLIHELAHAFVTDRSRGVAPREIQEGLAQYVEGQRSDGLGAGGMRALAEGRVQGVAGFYAFSLAFVEQLIAERGQGGMNDALRIMGETGRVDDAFSRVYGRTFSEAQRTFADRLRLQHAR